MNWNDVVERVEAFAQPHYTQWDEDAFIWSEHVPLVRHYALRLAQTEGANQRVIELAALLHDVGKDQGRENHHTRGAEICEPLLAELPITEPERQLILRCIRKHRSRFAGEDDKMEVRVLRSADALAVLFDERCQEFSRQTMPREHLLALYEKQLRKIELSSARQIAVPRIEQLKAQLDGHPREVLQCVW